jgi:hypothetical protein
MSIDAIQADFRSKVASEIDLRPEGIDRFRVVSPFQFEDGDHLVIVLRRDGNAWKLTDEGHTFMHLTYELEEADLQSGTRQKIIANTLSTFGVSDIDGELQVGIPDSKFGDALYSFIQALLKISDVTFLSRERVRSTFVEDLSGIINSVVPAGRFERNWHHPARDPHAKYTVDWRINERPRPLFVYGLMSDDRVRDAQIALLQFEHWGIKFHSVAIFEDQEQIGRKVLSRFSDVCEKQFSSLDARDRIARYLEEQLQPSEP